MRRYNNYDYDDRDFSVEDSLNDYDLRNYATPHTYHNMDYDDRNFWQPENEYRERNYENNFIEDPYANRERHLRPLHSRRRIFLDEGDHSVNNRPGRRHRNEDFEEERHRGRNDSDYYGRYDDGNYYRNDEHHNSHARNRNERYYDEDDGERRRTRWTDFYNYYENEPSYRDELENEGRHRRRHGQRDFDDRLDREDYERGEFSDRKHRFGYYADMREDEYKRKRPYIRDSRY